MRRLLAALVIAMGLAVLMPSDTRPALAFYPYDTSLYLYHPVGYQGSTQARLECGWHENCEGWMLEQTLGG